MNASTGLAIRCRNPRARSGPLRAAAFVAVTLAVLGGGAGSTRAAGEEPGVARVSLVEGQASYFRNDGDDWSGVSVNAPLVTGDRFYSGAESRAEIQLASGVYARLGSETELGMTELAPNAVQVRLPLGRAILRVRKQSDRHVEVDTPSVALVVRGPGVYRIDVDATGETRVQVREGAVTAHGGGGEERLSAGDAALFHGPGEGDASSTLPISASPPDDFDAWENERAQRIERAASYQYVSEDIYGAEDLDEYGTWEYRRGYGQLWRPTAVAAGWAPYSAGRWSWVSPWGWTWLDYAPWGWAPFHYGRWVYLDNSWWWGPGPVVAAPVYAPALVGFYGFGYGGGVSISVGFGPAVGWVPLGWGEPCLPWWGGWGGAYVGRAWWGGWGGPRIVNNYVINNYNNVYNIDARKIRFQNRNFPGGMTTVTQRSFQNGHLERVPIGDVDRLSPTPIGGRVPITPERGSLRSVDPVRARVTRAAIPPERAGTAPTVLARQPAARQFPESGATAPVGRQTVSRTAGPEDGGTGRSPSNPTVGRSAMGTRPVDTGRGARRMPVAPRPDGRVTTPYVARRPAEAGSDASRTAVGARGDSSGSGLQPMRFPTSGTQPARTGGSRDAVGANIRTGNGSVSGAPPRSPSRGNRGSLSVVRRSEGATPSGASSPRSPYGARSEGRVPDSRSAPGFRATAPYAPRVQTAPAAPVVSRAQAPAYAAPRAAIQPSYGGGSAGTGGMRLGSAGGAAMSGMSGARSGFGGGMSGVRSAPGGSLSGAGSRAGIGR